MVDSVKQYNLAGIAAKVELGKQGPVIDASDPGSIQFKDKNGNASVIKIAQGSDATHGVTLDQLNAVSGDSLVHITTTVNYDSGTVVVGNVSADTYIYRVSVEKGPGNWTGADSSTEITVGDSSDNARLYSGFDPAVQTASDINYEYASNDTISVFVTQGGASAGTAKVTIWYSGTIE